MQLADKIVVVAGGTGNVAGFVVDALLHQGATVVVPSRSEEKLVSLKACLIEQGSKSGLARLKTFVADLSEANEADALQQRIKPHVVDPKWSRMS